MNMLGLIDENVCIHRLLKAANYNVKKAEIGIVFIDEIDNTRVAILQEVKNILGRGIQQALLILIEDTTVEVHFQKGGKPIPVKTKNILFIFAGAFSDLPSIIQKDLRKRSNPLAVENQTLFEINDNVKLR